MSKLRKILNDWEIKFGVGGKTSLVDQEECKKVEVERLIEKYKTGLISKSEEELLLLHTLECAACRVKLK